MHKNTCAVCIAVTFASCVSAAVIRVPSDYDIIQDAIDATADGDTVLVMSGEYVMCEPLTFRGKAITVQSEAGPGETTLRMADTPADPYRASVVIFENNEDKRSVLKGFTLTGGGARVFCIWDDCLSEPYGGGAVIRDSSPTLTNCTVTWNLDTGVQCLGLSSPRLADCTIAGNAGEGLYCAGAFPVLANCTIAGNLGCGISAVTRTHKPSTVTLTNCIVWDNRGAITTRDDSTVVVSYSCIESADVYPGAGNLNHDPLFCGWGAASEVYVDDSNPPPGDGTRDNPYWSLSVALDYRLALASSSPCLEAGEGGTRIGAESGICDGPGVSRRLVHVAEGTYRVG